MADIESVDIICTDPPYSERTHAGYRSGPDAGLDDAAKTPARIGYEPLGDEEVPAFVAAWAERIQWWSITFCDHTGFRRWEAAWSAAGWITFAPVLWLKRNAPPRFAGDGPQSAAEYLCVARPAKRVRDHRSRPGWYDVQTQPAAGVVGTKDVGGLVRLLSDYSRPGDLVADPFGGSASVGEACVRTGRRYVGAECDPATWEIGRRRLDLALADPVVHDRWGLGRQGALFPTEGR